MPADKSKKSKSKKPASKSDKPASKRRKPAARRTKPASSKPSYSLFLILFVLVLIAAASGIYINRQLEKMTSKTPEKRIEQPINLNPEIVRASGCIPVYYYDNEAQFFVPVHIPLADETTPLDIRARKIIDKIIAGPPVDDLIGVIPEGVQVNSVKVETDMVIVDFTSEIANYGGGSAWEKGIVQSVVLSLTELPGIKRVQILVDGKKLDYLPEGTEISEPLTREGGGPNSSEYVPDGKSAGYLYFLDKSDKFLVPVYWTWDGEQDNPLAKLNAIYQSPPPPLSQSLDSPAPSGTTIVKCEIDGDTLNLIINHHDFPTAFSGRSPKLFLEATLLTLYQLKPFSRMDIRVGSETDNLSLWSFSAFADLEKTPIPPVCFNELNAAVKPAI